MRCFLACFLASKHGRHRRLVKAPNPLGQSTEGCKANQAAEFVKQRQCEKLPAKSVRIPKLERPEIVTIKNKVTVDSILKSDDKLPDERVKDGSVEKIEVGNGKKDEEKLVKSEVLPSSNYRYRHRGDVRSDSGDLGIEGPESINDNCQREDAEGIVMQESSESLFSLSIGTGKRCCDVELGGEIEVTSPVMSKPVDSPVEAPKSTEDWDSEPPEQRSSDNPVEKKNQHDENLRDDTFILDLEKENMVVSNNVLRLVLEEPISKMSITKSKTMPDKKVGDQEIAVETSLSSWLVQSEGTDVLKDDDIDSDGKSPLKSQSSSRCHQNRIVLGALQSPVRAAKPCADEVPVIGTIGSYWSRTRLSLVD